ncbi:GNAT family N-acetyltransferase [Microlunatus panaciterrae]|uniref:GNAT superfamily N-acetyltransferase n=1 Tax=Microlunatus panaciterrae TaxID=400768 RepID=A0ABS2RII1_9ACTN|nr:GNAT family N-acetyltransferase [Microlunatus panaciterrae]MBM7797779.1 GNAT superfamily N-acetyltransferase [Microlunatus panaciterrae]
MPFLRVRPDDPAMLDQFVRLVNDVRQHDDPDTPPVLAGLVAGDLTYGWDLEPGEQYLYLPEGAQEPVGSMGLAWPLRDNLHLVAAEVTVHPDHRRQGHGSAIVREILRRTRQLGRDTIWISTAEDDDGARSFAEAHGFVYASHDARRRQVLAEVDQAEVARLEQSARAAAVDYQLERLVAPTSDDVLAELVEVTAAINDAPMGDLTFEEEKFDLQRLKDFETANAGRGNRLYRVIARHRATGEVGGHTIVGVHPLQPEFAYQGDTAVSRKHRGHRLGLLLKIDMMRWMAEVEPQFTVIETWNHADNTFMINVNEAIGYRLSRVFAAYQLVLTDPADGKPEDLILNAGGV